MNAQIEILTQSLERLEYLKTIVAPEFEADLLAKEALIKNECELLTLAYVSQKFGMDF